MPIFAPLVTHPAQLTGGVLEERMRKNREVLLRGIDTTVLQRVYAETHDGWFAEPEFCGQYIDSALAAYRATGAEEWLDRAGSVVESIIRHQRADGYLGTYHPGLEYHTFSVWNQQFTIMGLLGYYEQTGEKSALQAAMRSADYVRRDFLAPGGPDVVDAVNMGIQHSCILREYLHLYRLTNERKYLDFALHIVGRWEATSLRLISGPNRYPDFPVMAVGSTKGMEVLVCYLGILELYRATGDEQYLRAVRTYWQGVRDSQIGPTGNGTIAECWWFVGNKPVTLTNELRPNENCVAVGWMQLSAALLAQSGEAGYADEFEKTLYNHLLGAQALDGSDFSYYQGLEGRKVHHTPSTWYSCCRYRGMKMMAHLGEWVMLAGEDGPVVNLYTPAIARLALRDMPVTVRQETDYPRNGHVRLTVTPERETAFTLRMRRPAFCPHASLSVNGRPVGEVPEQDGFLCLTRSWSATGDIVELDLSLSTRVTRAVINDERPCALVTHGPMVLAIDSRYGAFPDVTRLTLSGDSLALEPSLPSADTWTPIVRFHAPGTIAGAATSVPMVDYASAGSQDPQHDQFQTWVGVE